MAPCPQFPWPTSKAPYETQVQLSYADATAKLLKHDDVSAEDATRQVADVLKGIVEDFIEEDLGSVIDDVYFDEVTK